MSRLCLALLVLLTPALAVPTATAGDGASDRRARAHRDTVVVEWNEVSLEAIRRVAARSTHYRARARRRQHVRVPMRGPLTIARRWPPRRVGRCAGPRTSGQTGTSTKR